jgi:hypothetical protein
MRRLEKGVQFIFCDALESDEESLVRKATAAVVNKLGEEEQEVIDSLLLPLRKVVRPQTSKPSRSPSTCFRMVPPAQGLPSNNEDEDEAESESIHKRILFFLHLPPCVLTLAHA